MRGFGSVAKWHWVSSAVCLVGLLLFTVTGITLNHAQSIEAIPQVTTVEGTVPLTIIHAIQQPEAGTQPVPAALKHWLHQEHNVHIALRPAEWSEFDLYVSLPRPGGDAWLSVDLQTGDFIYEQTWRGTIGYLNDLHKGRNTGKAWQWFIDIFAIACLIFTLTGFILLFKFAKNRWSTWPLVTLGLLIPIIILLLTGV